MHKKKLRTLNAAAEKPKRKQPGKKGVQVSDMITYLEMRGQVIADVIADLKKFAGGVL
jgi:hypothetical protein